MTRRIPLHVMVLATISVGISGHPALGSELLLTCIGTEAQVAQTGSTTTVTVRPGIVPGIGSAQHQAAVAAQTATTTTSSTPTYSSVRVPAQMTVAITDNSIRIRPPANNSPSRLSGKRSTDGWYELSEIEATDRSFRGRASFGALLSGKYRLIIDRLSGDAEFGDFRGTCEKSATAPAERKF